MTLPRKLSQMNEVSQTHILGSVSAYSVLSNVPLDTGSKLILAMPSLIYLALGWIHWIHDPRISAEFSSAVHCTCDEGVTFQVQNLANNVYNCFHTENIIYRGGAVFE